MASMSMPSGTPRCTMASRTSSAQPTDSSGVPGVGVSSGMSSGAPGSGPDVVRSMSSLLSASGCREASSSWYRVLLRTPLMESRVRPGVICTNRWLMFLTPDRRNTISACARIKSVMIPACLSPNRRHILSVILIGMRLAPVLGETPRRPECPGAFGADGKRSRVRRRTSLPYIICGGSGGRPRLSGFLVTDK